MSSSNTGAARGAPPTSHCTTTRNVIACRKLKDLTEISGDAERKLKCNRKFFALVHNSHYLAQEGTLDKTDRISRNPLERRCRGGHQVFLTVVKPIVNNRLRNDASAKHDRLNSNAG
jgi:hypothetical protein